MIKLIIVDDESRIRRGLKNCLDWNELGVSIVGEASDGYEALELMEKFNPEIVITDIKMPWMGGLEFVKKLRKKNADTHIIIISGYNDFSFAQQAIKYNVNEYILKPVKETELKVIIGNCIIKIEEKQSYTKIEKIIEHDLSCIKVNSPYYKLMKKALNYIHENLNNEISLIDIAEEVNLHPNYFSRLFKEVFGESFSKYVIKVRMIKAKEYLDCTEYKIYEVSEMVGYSDFRHFSKLFKQFEGLTPNEYRRKS